MKYLNSESSLASKTADSGYYSPVSLLLTLVSILLRSAHSHFRLLSFSLAKTIDRAASSTRNIPSLFVLWINLLYIR